MCIACREAPDSAEAAPVVEWAERGGPPVVGPPTKRGFGLRLLNGGLPAQAGMGADLRFEPEGVRCTFRLPPSRTGSPTKAGWGRRFANQGVEVPPRLARLPGAPDARPQALDAERRLPQRDLD